MLSLRRFEKWVMKEMISGRAIIGPVWHFYANDKNSTTKLVVGQTMLRVKRVENSCFVLNR